MKCHLETCGKVFLAEGSAPSPPRSAPRATAGWCPGFQEPRHPGFGKLPIWWCYCGACGAKRARGVKACVLCPSGLRGHYTHPRLGPAAHTRGPKLVLRGRGAQARDRGRGEP